MSSLVVPVSFENIFFNGHSEHLQFWVTESIPLIILNVWMMSVLCLLYFRVGRSNFFSLQLCGRHFVSGTRRVALL